MILFQFDHVYKSYGADDILVDVSWQIPDDARIGLIGPNGAGKTTLAKLLIGVETPSSGAIHKRGSVTIGYLNQEPELPAESTVREYALSADKRLVDLRNRLRALEHRLASGQASESETHRYGTLQEEYRHLGGYEYEAHVATVLSKLGFREREHDRSLQVLSGGQQSRLELASLLIRRPDLLVLDEPTNHLDIQGIEWLETFLASYAGAVLVISHDRVFLDRVVNRIVEIEFTSIEEYVGNYSAYVEEREQRVTRRRKIYEEQREMIERTEDFIRRNIAGQKTKQAQARRKMLEKVERVTPPTRQRHVRLNFPVSRRGGNQVIEVRGLTKSFGNLSLFEDLSFLVRRGERIGVVGPNGSGKSTLLRIIIDEENADAGTIRIGTGIEVGYFDQRREGLNEANSVIDEVWAMKPSMMIGEVRSYLGTFNFSEDEHFRIVGTLSGGEQSRVALAKLILDQTNFLILDEPTNHLDIPSRLALEAALERYEGTLFMVSHDRAFLRKLTNATIVIDNGQAQHYEFGYRAYEEHIAQKADAERIDNANLGNSATPMQTSEPDAEKAARVREHQLRKEDQRRRERRERRWTEIESAIMELEDEIARLNDEMGKPEIAADWQELGSLTAERQQRQGELDALFDEWSELERHSSIDT